MRSALARPLLYLLADVDPAGTERHVNRTDGAKAVLHGWKSGTIDVDLEVERRHARDLAAVAAMLDCQVRSHPCLPIRDPLPSPRT